MDVGQPLVAAAEAEGELGVVEAQLVQDRGVDVVESSGLIDGGVAELVGLAVGGAALEAAAGQADACSR